MTTSRYVRSQKGGAGALLSKSDFLNAYSGERILSLRYLSMKHVLMAPGAVRGPHWHEEASELVFCLSGNLQVSILGEGDAYECVSMRLGTMLHIGPTALQTIENVGDSFAELIVVTGFEELETSSLLHAFTAMSERVNKAYRTPAGTNRVIVAPDLSIKIETPPIRALDTGGRRFESNGDAGHYAGCLIRAVRTEFLPVLKDLSLCAPRVVRSGSREARQWPHHVAMAYIYKGRARLAVLDKEGQVATYELDPGVCSSLSWRCHVPGIEPFGESRPPIIVFEHAMLGDAIYRSATCSLTSTMLSAMCDLENSAFHLPSCEGAQTASVRWIDLPGGFHEPGQG